MIKEVADDELIKFQTDDNYSPRSVAPYQAEALQAFFDEKNRLFMLAGSRESGKSHALYTMLEMLLRGQLGNWKANILLMRTTKESARKTIFYGTIGKVLSNMGIEYKDLERADLNRGVLEINGHTIRLDSFAVDVSSMEKLKGYEGVTHVFIEELAELPNYEMFDQLFKTINRRIEIRYKDSVWNDSLQAWQEIEKTHVTHGKLICAYNTPPVNHWITRQYYDLLPVTTKDIPEEAVEEYEITDDDLISYQKLIPKSGEIPNSKHGFRYEDRPIFYSFSTIFDNTVLKESTIEKEGERDWHLHLLNNHGIWKQLDPYRFYTESLGLVGSGKSGKVYTNWSEIDMDKYNEITPDIPVFYGIDFGFSTDVSSVAEIKVKKGAGLGGRDVLYVRPVIYRRNLLTSTLGSLILQEVPSYQYAEFFADGSSPEAISELQIIGLYNITRTLKKNDYKTPAVSWLSGFEVYYVDTEVTDNLLIILKSFEMELARTCWLQDREGNPLNKVSDGFDHFLDSVLYGAYTKLHPDNVSTGSMLFDPKGSLMTAFANNKI